VTLVGASFGGWLAAEIAICGLAVWGGGRYWELRTTPFHVAVSDADVG
jgi:hypothetical protein